MVQVPESLFYKGALLDSFEQKGYVYSKSPPATAPSPPAPVSSPPPSTFLNFLEKSKNSIIDNLSAPASSPSEPSSSPFLNFLDNADHKKIIATSAFAIGAWLMPLNGGATAAGSLVAILQSIGAAGLTAGATIGTGAVGATIMAGLAKLFAERLNFNHEGQAQLDEFVKVYDEDKNSEKGSIRVVFELRDKLLTNDEAFDNFLEIFTLTYCTLDNRKQQFKFFVDETCVIDKMDIAEKKLEILNDHLVKNYGAERVDKQVQSYSIMLNCNNS
ncbi:hypothetical protein C2G38_2203570 [Gigaspora rosea]|uniref:Uncharacterized protein n=1 Tax=Gigaspora rosea TaxID=44941 RepID=A0A397UMK6_9GLOM|nr:hypothetical protein C2G38_2203570 [Gigaspora rosea]